MRLGIFEIETSDIEYIRADSKGELKLELVDGTKIDIQLPNNIDQDLMIDSINALKDELDQRSRPSRLITELTYDQ